MSDVHDLTALARFRYRLFVEALGWDLAAPGQREEDQFDRPDTVYCVLYDGDEIVGCFRVIRTDQPYLAKSVFPETAEFRPFPMRTDMYEISRFGVLSAGVDRVAVRALYGLVFHYGLARRATSLVALSDLGHERYVRRLGIRTRRYGHPRVIGLNARGEPIVVVAGEIPLGEQSGEGFARLLAFAETLEIDDETLVLGRSRISA